MPDFLQGFVPRATIHDGRQIERALAPDLLSPRPKLSAALVEATFAATEPPLLQRFEELGVPYAVDPQTNRFCRPTFSDVDRLRRLPYAAGETIMPGSSLAAHPEAFIEEILRFQNDAGAAVYVAPYVPLQDDGLSAWQALNEHLVRLAVNMNGRDVPHKPLAAVVCPGRRALGSPKSTLGPLGDILVDAIFIEPLNLDPVHDSIEKLVQYVRFIDEAQQLWRSVLASRVGAFGLLVAARGASFSSGLGEAERSDYASLCRIRLPALDADGSPKSRGGAKRVYLEALKTTLPAKKAECILREASIRARFACGLACCRFSGFDDLASRSRQHYLLTRLHEVNLLSDRPVGEMRLALIEEQVVRAQDTARLARKTLGETSALPSFEHLDNWLAVLARMVEVPVSSR